MGPTEPSLELPASNPAQEPARWPHNCDTHQSIPAWAACADCGRYVCRTCRTLDAEDGHSTCETCLQARAHKQLVADQVARAAAEGVHLSPHDVHIESVVQGELEPKRISDYLQTLKLLTVSPSRFFLQLHPQDNVVHALLFGVFFGSLGLFFSLAWTSGTPEFEEGVVMLMEQYGVGRNMVFLTMVMSLPLLTALEILLYTIGISVMLAMTRAPKQGLVITLKMVSYAMIARLALMLPGEFGSFAGLLWFMLLLTNAGRRIYKLNFTQTLLVIGVPILLLTMMGGFAFT